MLYKIDRSKGFGSLIGQNNLTTYAEICQEDPVSKSVQEVDLSSLQLVTLLDGTFSKVAEVNTQIRQRKKELKLQGVVFADAYVGELLLYHKEYFVDDWAKSGSLRFDGTIFCHRTDKAKRLVLSPFMERGRWGHGTLKNTLSLEEFALLNKGKGVYLKQQTVVIP